MARKPRVWYPGAIYHIMCRGNNRQEIFRDDMDRSIYIERLVHAKEKYRCTVLSYCLMTNHVHLQLETSDVEIWKMMKQLNMRYVMYFNRKYNSVGHLFQGRYRAELIKTYGHIIRISRYIHLNPVVAGMVDAPSEYPWSSYRDYIGEGANRVVTPNRILDYFPNQSRELYRKYVEEHSD